MNAVSNAVVLNVVVSIVMEPNGRCWAGRWSSRTVTIQSEGGLIL